MWKDVNRQKEYKASDGMQRSTQWVSKTMKEIFTDAQKMKDGKIKPAKQYSSIESFIKDIQS